LLVVVLLFTIVGGSRGAPVANVSAWVLGGRLKVVNRGPEKITLTNIVANAQGLIAVPSGLEGGGVGLSPGETHEILLGQTMEYLPYVDFDIEFIDRTGLTMRSLRLKI
jgi:hypothetical protein